MRDSWGSGFATAPPPVNSAAAAPSPPKSRPPTLPGPHRRCSYAGWKCAFTIFVLLAIIAVAVVVPLYVTGVIGGRRRPTVRRTTYDPYYYGNLHPYLYPGEREELGIVTDYDVVVVGAGLAGLGAAAALQQEGLTVLVLEARVGV